VGSDFVTRPFRAAFAVLVSLGFAAPAAPAHAALKSFVAECNVSLTMSRSAGMTPVMGFSATVNVGGLCPINTSGATSVSGMGPMSGPQFSCIEGVLMGTLTMSVPGKYSGGVTTVITNVAGVLNVEGANTEFAMAGVLTGVGNAACPTSWAGTLVIEDPTLED
jgi:hypothetical protein